MKKFLSTETLDRLLQIIIICFMAIIALTILESCEAEHIKKEEKRDMTKSLPLCTLNQAGEDDMNIVFLPEGYTAEQMDVFMQEVMLAWKILRQTKPYSHSLDKISVYYSTALASVSDTIGSGNTVFGLATPKAHQAYCEINCDSLCNVSRRLSLPVEKTIIVVMANCGKGTDIGYTLITTPSPRMPHPITVVIRSLFCKNPAAFTHEMGHAAGLLADEYYYESLVFGEQESKSLLNWQKEGISLNVSVSSNATEVYWSQFINDEDFANEKIGIYEGGDTYPNGVYRSTFNSVMRYHFQSDFYNALDRYLIYRRIENMHSGRDISYEEWKQIDLAHVQPPIDWHSLTGGITRSENHTSTDYQLFTEPDVIWVE
jgi:hypothetical protein